MLEHIPIPARPVRGSRTPVPFGDWLVPIFIHKLALKGQAPVCRTKAGRPRAYHATMDDGLCIHCGEYNPMMDLPLGRRR